MNQEEREAFFKGKPETLSYLAEKYRTDRRDSPHGNPERSFVGEKWFYYGKKEMDCELYCDEVIAETDTHVFVVIRKNIRDLLDNPVAISKEHYLEMYPIQDVFPCPMDWGAAVYRLSEHLKNQQ